MVTTMEETPSSFPGLRVYSSVFPYSAIEGQASSLKKEEVERC